MPNSTTPTEEIINEERISQFKILEDSGGGIHGYEAVFNSDSKGELIKYFPPAKDEKVTRLFIPAKEQYGVKRYDLQKAKLTSNGETINVNVKIVDEHENDVSTNYTEVNESTKVKYHWSNATMVVGVLGGCAFFGYVVNILNNLIGGAVLTKAAAFTAAGGGMGILIGTVVLCLVVASIGAARVDKAEKKEQCASTVGQTETPQSAAGISREQDPKIGTINTNNDRLHTIRGDVTVVAQKDGTGNKCP